MAGLIQADGITWGRSFGRNRVPPQTLAVIGHAMLSSADLTVSCDLLKVDIGNPFPGSSGLSRNLEQENRDPGVDPRAVEMLIIGDSVHDLASARKYAWLLGSV